MPKVLITKDLNNEQEALAHEYGLNIVEEPLIKITYKYDTVLVPKADAWVISSPNGAKYVASHFDSFPKDDLPDKIFVTGKGTAEKVDHLGIPVEMPDYGTAENLAKLVQQSGVNSVVFFSGNLRSETIPAELADLDVHEIQVYKTELLEKKFNMSEFAGVAFFSPSGVEAFAKNNKIDGQVVIAVGTTTKRAVRDILGIEAGIPATTSVEDVLFALKSDLKNR